MPPTSSSGEYPVVIFWDRTQGSEWPSDGDNLSGGESSSSSEDEDSDEEVSDDDTDEEDADEEEEEAAFDDVVDATEARPDAVNQALQDQPPDYDGEDEGGDDQRTRQRPCDRLRTYYSGGSFYGSTAAYVAYRLAMQLRFGEQGDLLWLACVGVTDVYLFAFCFPLPFYAVLRLAVGFRLVSRFAAFDRPAVSVSPRFVRLGCDQFVFYSTLSMSECINTLLQPSLKHRLQ